MQQGFNIGDHVGWNREAGQVSSHISTGHQENLPWKDYTRHANAQAPQYQLKSDQTRHIAVRQCSALHHIHD